MTSTNARRTNGKPGSTAQSVPAVSESKILAQVLWFLGRRPDVRCWRANCGVARALSSDHIIRYGIPGQADISGILSDGRRLEIETKTARRSQSKQQVAFQAMIEKFNGVYIVARSADDALAQLRAKGHCHDSP